MSLMLLLVSVGEHLGKFEFRSTNSNSIIGFKPGKVSDFKCRSNNWQNMTCSFRQMYNPIITTYNLSFQTTLTQQTFSCPLKNEYKGMYSCFLNHTYRPAHETYIFKLVSNNSFGEYTEEFEIDNFASVILAPPVSIEPKNVTDKSVVLEWNISSKLMGFRKDIVHQVKICSVYRPGDWKTVTLVLPVNGTTYQLKLDNLEFAHTWYDVRISLRSQKAPDTAEMWSNYTATMFLTNARRPDTPPEVDIGGFHINDNRDIVIYWKTLPQAYQNGINAGYRIRQVFENGKLKNRTPDMSASTMARFNHMPDYDYEFLVESVNEKGASINSSVIRVPRRDKRLAGPTRFKKLFIDGKYKLSWSPADQYPSNIDSYTIFWCRSKNELPNQCDNNSSINFTHVNGITHYFNYPTSDTINFAVSANRGNTSSGMVWAMCTAAESNDIGKLKTIWIPKMEPTRMVIQWKLECVDSSIVEGYNLTYCPISSPRNIDCKEPPVFVNITGGRDVTKYEINDLRPYTTYKTLISMFSKTRMGPESEPLVNTTMESCKYFLSTI
jgi:cytokine receptor domeless